MSLLEGEAIGPGVDPETKAFLNVPQSELKPFDERKTTSNLTLLAVHLDTCPGRIRPPSPPDVPCGGLLGINIHSTNDRPQDLTLLLSRQP
jgi:hypothetical protein